MVGGAFALVAIVQGVIAAAPETDLKELWRRMVFSYFIGNTDDHLRNHGFLLTPKGWRLAPLFDVNPNPDGGDHALDLGDPVKDADYYRLTQAEARRQYEEIRITAANLLK